MSESDRDFVYSSLMGRLEKLGAEEMSPAGDQNFQNVFQTVSLFETVIEALPILFVDMDSGEILYASRIVENLFGYYIRGELFQRNVDDLVPLEFRANHVNHRKEFTKDPRQRMMGQRNARLYGMHQDGHTFPVEISLSAIKMAGKKCVVAVILDMSKRVEDSA